MVEHQRRGQVQPGVRAEPVAQQNAPEGREPEGREGPVRYEVPRGHAARSRRPVEDDAQDGVVTLGRGQNPQALAQGGRGGLARRLQLLGQPPGQGGAVDLAGARTGDGAGLVHLVGHLEARQALLAQGA